MDKAFIGLVGVVLGVFLSMFKDWLLQRIKTKKEYEYLTIRVACVLDRFVYSCVDVVNDNGTYLGQYDKDGCAQVQVILPTFNPYDLDVEWKSIPHTLMYEILNFPNRIETANHTISSAFDYAASPPYYEEGFAERQYQYSKLGICASKLATNLRNYGKLPTLEFPENWNPNKILNEKLAKIQAHNEAHEEAHTKLMQKLQNP
jgi:hypothetical protein